MATYFGSALVEQIERTTAAPGSLALWGLGQMGLVVKGQRTVLVIDPCLSDMGAPADSPFQRAFPAPVLPAEFTNADYVLCSHEHGDHTDALTIAGMALASPHAKVVITGWSQALLDQAKVSADRRIVADQAALHLGEFVVTPVPSAHYTRERDGAKGERWLGFHITGNGVTLYHSGDTVIFPGYVDSLKALPVADVAMLPVNGRDAYRDSFNITGNLLPAEASWLTKQLGWDMLLVGHNDLFTFNALPIGTLTEGVASMNPRQKWHILQPGELFVYVK
jgi:L-ascorbate 6-phosphate lactonase